MPSRTGSRLAGLRVLIVEDEYLVALDLEAILTGLGCAVVGPAPDVASALRLLRTAAADLAILDVKLGTALVYPVAHRLTARGIPFLFATGYPEATIPAAYKAVPRLQKPFDPDDVQWHLERLAAGRGRSPRP